MSSLPTTASHEIPLAREADAGGGRRLPASLALARHAGLPLVVALSAVLNVHRLSQNGWSNIFYSAAVRSMLRSWHNFVFVSFDPGGLISVDKPPLALWVQAASAKIFGFTPLAVLLPEAIIGVLTVALLYVIVARRLGAAAAFASAFALAVFPSFVAVSRDNGVDALLILLMLAACGAGLRAAETGRVRWIVASGVFIGLAFNTKTLAAYLAVPGIAAAYLLCAPVSWRTRALGLLAGGIAMLIVSGAWIAYVEATPASKRPFVGSSTNNTQLGLTFEYNGFGRVEGQLGGPDTVLTLPGARPVYHHSPHHAAPAVVGTTVGAAHAPTKGPNSSTFLRNGHYRNPFPFGGKPSPVRLWGKGLGDQDGWQIPLALFGAIALALLAAREWRGRRRPDDLPGIDGREEPRPQAGAGPLERLVRRLRPARAAPAPPPERGALMPFLLVMGGWFLVEVIVLSGSKGIVHPYYASALAPATGAMAGVGALGLVRLREDGRWLAAVALAGLSVAGSIAAQTVLLHRERYLLWLVPVFLVVGALALLGFALSRSLARPAVVLMFALFMIVPTAYATTTWLGPVEGTFPAAGPKFAEGTGGVGIAGPELRVDRALIAYITTHGATKRFPLFTVSSTQASPFILMGVDAAALGGYSGSDPALDGTGVAKMVERHEARYVLLGGDYSTRGGNKATAAVLRACKELSLSTWHSPLRYVLDALTLFDCKGDARALRR
ncbi:MAG TPA: glycosyltransferase family 39 protein [Solirubrobacteraceae bacterium]|jgi:4-amino-4-deoxy-L-arabinose transferase-like glycosyltransferase|nr:glycosyltransferase family 39 protein [Solirubrobacteraceae bacterium]